MKKSWILGAALTVLVMSGVNAQQGNGSKARKEAAVVKADAEVAADKASLKTLRAEKKADKMNGDRTGLKEDRGAVVKGEGRLLKDQVKKDAAKVKKAL